jgi:hypothetical protein
MAICHPDRVRAGRGLCDACYMRHYRAKPSGISMRDHLKHKGVAIL